MKRLVVGGLCAAALAGGLAGQASATPLGTHKLCLVFPDGTSAQPVGYCLFTFGATAPTR